MTPEQRITQLERQVQELLDWKKARMAQQITFPLDNQSRTILNNYFLSVVDDLTFVNASGLEFTSWYVRQGPIGGIISIGFPNYLFTASASTNKLSIGRDIVTGAQGSFADDQQVFVKSTGTLPAPLTDLLPYYVVNEESNGTVIQLSSTLGGSAIDITDAGTGEHFIEFFT